MNLTAPELSPARRNELGGLRYNFVALEGTDGSGKTRIRKFLFDRLKSRGVELLNITPHSWLNWRVARGIVNLKQHGGQCPAPQITSAYVTDKERHSATIVRPHLPLRPVLADRFVASDIVYHKVLWNIPEGDTYRAFDRSSVLWPDLHIMVMTPPEVAFKRAQLRRSGNGARWDELQIKERLYRCYWDLLRDTRYPRFGRTIFIDNSRDFSVTEEQLETLVIPTIVNKVSNPWPEQTTAP
jgi:dTMP kinase